MDHLLKTIDYTFESMSVLYAMCEYTGDKPLFVRWIEPELNAKRRARGSFTKEEAQEMFAIPMRVYSEVKPQVPFSTNEIRKYFLMIGELDFSLASIIVNLNRIEIGNSSESELLARRIKALCKYISLFINDSLPPATSLKELSKALDNHIDKLGEFGKMKIIEMLLSYDEYSAQVEHMLAVVGDLLKDKIHLFDEELAITYQDLQLQSQQYGGLIGIIENVGFGLSAHEITMYVSLMFPSVVDLDIYPEDDGIVEVHYGSRFNSIRGHTTDEDILNDLLVCQSEALGDRVRFAIMRALRDGPKCGLELATLTGLTSATVSHHMEKLTISGLIIRRIEGKKTLYTVNEAAMKYFAEHLIEQTVATPK